MWCRSALALLLAVSARASDGAAKLDEPLRALSEGWRQNRTRGLRAAAARYGVPLRGRRVKVRIAAVSEIAVAPIRAAALHGGRVVVTEGLSVFAELPAADLAKIAADPGVLGIYADGPEHRSQTKEE
jgi:hypothetical protein